MKSVMRLCLLLLVIATRPGPDVDLVSQTIVRQIQKAGIKDASLHTLRHIFKHIADDVFE